MRIPNRFSQMAPLRRAALAAALCLALAAGSARAEADAAADPATVVLDFQNADITEVVQQIAKIAKKRFVYDDRISGNITILSGEPVTVDQAFRIFESTLHMKGFTLVDGSTGELRIVPVGEARQLPLEVLDSATPPPDRDVFTTKIVALRHVKVDAIKQTVLELASPDAGLVADLHSNTLILTDTAANIRRMMEVISAIDAPAFEGVTEVIALDHADATGLVDKLRAVFHEREDGKREKAGEGLREPLLIADRGTNSLLIVATPAVSAEVKRLVALLDQKRPGAGSLNIYRVQNADAEELAKTLAVLSDGGAAGESGTRVAGAPAAALAGVKITADAPTNSLIVQSSPKDYAALLDIIGRLDRERPQVFIELLMLEREGGEGEVLGTDFLYNTLYRGGARGSPAVGFRSGGSGPDSASGGGAFRSTLIGDTVTLSDAQGRERTVPVIEAVIEAAQKDQDINVVSAPQIVTADNEEARIVVGEKRGFPVSRLQAVDPSGVSPFQTSTQIERQDVGVTLRVTPQITEGDSVRMKIFTELSHVTEAENPFGPTTSHREIENTVYVKDGESVMIGGIMRDHLETGENRVPVLGGLPLLGRAFRSRSDRVVKTNLLLLLTPRIVRSPEHLAALSAEGRERFKLQAKGSPGEAQTAAALPQAPPAAVDRPADPEPIRREPAEEPQARLAGAPSQPRVRPAHAPAPDDPLLALAEKLADSPAPRPAAQAKSAPSAKPTELPRPLEPKSGLPPAPAHSVQAEPGPSAKPAKPSAAAETRPAAATSPRAVIAKPVEEPKPAEPKRVVVSKPMPELKPAEPQRVVVSKPMEEPKPAGPRRVVVSKPMPEPKPAEAQHAAGAAAVESAESAASHSLEELYGLDRGYVVQLPGIADPQQANAVVARLAELGHSARLIEERQGGQVLQRIRLGPYPSRTEARRVDRQVEKALGMQARVLFGS